APAEMQGQRGVLGVDVVEVESGLDPMAAPQVADGVRDLDALVEPGSGGEALAADARDAGDLESRASLVVRVARTVAVGIERLDLLVLVSELDARLVHPFRGEDVRLRRRDGPIGPE